MGTRAQGLMQVLLPEQPLPAPGRGRGERHRAVARGLPHLSWKCLSIVAKIEDSVRQVRGHITHDLLLLPSWEGG